MRFIDQYLPNHAFETLDGNAANILLDCHADGKLVSLGAFTYGAAVWDLETGKIVWKPEGTSAICWSSDGREIYLVTEQYERADEHPSAVKSPPQIKLTYVLERRSWPERELLGTCNLRFRTGWPIGVLASPRNDLIAVNWMEEDCAGFILVERQPSDVLCQLHADCCFDQSNFTMGPVFSPDGRYLVFVGTRLAWWSPDPEEWEMPAVGGRVLLGEITILDTTTMIADTIDVEEELAAGWLPPDPETAEAYTIGYPEFTGSEEFRVSLPTGNSKTYHVK